MRNDQGDEEYANAPLCTAAEAMRGTADLPSAGGQSTAPGSTRSWLARHGKERLTDLLPCGGITPLQTRA